jgi:predicted GIY-YIG superfamily endonuclease
MNITDLVPGIELRLQFNLRDWKFVPKSAGCYVLAKFDGEILYIGLSDNLYRRFSEHRDSDTKRLPTRNGLAFWFYYLLCETKELNRIERTWLNEHVTQHGVLPPLNKINSPVH